MTLGDARPLIWLAKKRRRVLHSANDGNPNSNDDDWPSQEEGRARAIRAVSIKFGAR